MNLKKLKVIIFGYGSIGRTHAKILNKMGVKNIYIYTKQKKLPYSSIKNLSQIEEINPDYVIIASSTSLHFKHLSFLEKKLKRKIILVEKPLFDKARKLRIKNNKVFVGYNLRFHPALRLVKNKIKNKKIWFALATCGSYLPNWRKNRKYYDSYSAKKKYGGGVLLELSHEFDYFLWLFKNFQIKYVYSKKISDLKINTDDMLDLVGKSSKINYLNIKLNYFFRRPVRKIIIEGKKISIEADLINNSLSIIEGTVEKKYFWPKLKLMDLYQKEHQNILNKNFKYLCTYREGQRVMYLINKILSYKKKFH